MPAAELSLGPDARSPGVARRFLLTTLRGWEHQEYADDAALLVSELVTNAALHARTDIVVVIELRSECLRLAVSDRSPRQPARRHYSVDSTTGRGLALVAALAQRWGIDANPDGSKTVWAELRAEGGDPARARPDEAEVDLTGFPELEEAGASAAGPRDQDQEETTGWTQAA